MARLVDDAADLVEGEFGCALGRRRQTNDRVAPCRRWRRSLSASFVKTEEPDARTGLRSQPTGAPRMRLADHRLEGESEVQMSEGEIIIVPVVAGIGDVADELFTLNVTGKAIWEQLDGQRNLAAAPLDPSALDPRASVKEGRVHGPRRGTQGVGTPPASCCPLTNHCPSSTWPTGSSSRSTAPWASLAMARVRAWRGAAKPGHRPPSLPIPRRQAGRSLGRQSRQDADHRLVS